MSLWNYKLKQWIPLYSYSKDLKQEQWQHQILVRMQSLFHSWRKANWDSHFGRQFGNFFSFFKLFLERGEGREKERERNVNVWLPPTGDLACNPGMCPDWKSNGWPFGLQDGTQSTEPHQPGPNAIDFLLWSSNLLKSLLVINCHLI